MAITLRSVKGSALTHTEVDINFRSFIYSSSFSGQTISLFTSASANNVQTLNLAPAIGTGTDKQIVYRSGSRNVGSDSLVYNYNTDTLRIAANTEITGSLVVKGTLQAESIHTTFTSSSVIFQSGSTKFGNTLDDTHHFTGSISLSGSAALRGEINFANFKQDGTAVNVRQGFVVLTHVSESLSFGSEAAAAAAGVPLGGLYRNGNFIHIRIT
jgi:hypothetical protein